MITPDTSHLPVPLNADSYVLLRTGVADDKDVNVYINEDRSFAFLDPSPSFDYAHYVPRVQALGLQAYKKSADIFGRRLDKIGFLLNDCASFLELGAADGAFLAAVHERFPMLPCAAIEPDQATRPARDLLPWLKQYATTREAIGTEFDLVGMFHVFEHMENPFGILDQLRPLLSSKGRLLIEVPSLSDPLLSLYRSATYEAFYFQTQHPFVYSATALQRVLAASNYAVEQVIPYQRYGLENHLQWLTAGQPGGNAEFSRVLAPVGASYREALENEGITDTLFVVARPA